MIAFVLSRGGSLGAIQVLAAEPTLPRAPALSDVRRSLKPREILPLGPIRTVKAMRRNGSFFPTAPLRQLIEQQSPYSRIERARISLRMIATDLADGTGSLFNCRTFLHDLHEESRCSDDAPVEEVVRLSADQAFLEAIW